MSSLNTITRNNSCTQHFQFLERKDLDSISIVSRSSISTLYKLLIHLLTSKAIAIKTNGPHLIVSSENVNNEW